MSGKNIETLKSYQVMDLIWREWRWNIAKSKNIQSARTV